MKQRSLCLLLMMILSFGICSCKRTTIYTDIQIKPDRGSFKPFIAFDKQFPPINNPQRAWRYRWEEGWKYTMETSCSPVVDEAGNCYFIGTNNWLYSISPKGELRWKHQGEGFEGDLVITKEGLLVNDLGVGLELFDQKGKVIWKKNLGKGIRNSYLSPDGYTLINKKNFHFKENGQSFNSCDLICLDSKGKIKWIHAIEDEKNRSTFLTSCFFDEKANIYFITQVYQSGKMSSTSSYYINSLSQSGILRFKRKINDGEKLVFDFLPESNQIKDRFLLAFYNNIKVKPGKDWYETIRDSSKDIVAYDTDGQEMWRFTESRKVQMDDSYGFDQNSNFYFTLASNYVNGTPGTVYLDAISMDGRRLWEREIIGSGSTGPIFDKDGNIYIGISSAERNLYSFSSNGTTRWKIKGDNAQNGYKFSLAYGLNQSIYYTSNFQNFIFCIKEQGK